jgi:hypothetical protein
MPRAPRRMGADALRDVPARGPDRAADRSRPRSPRRIGDEHRRCADRSRPRSPRRIGDEHRRLAQIPGHGRLAASASTVASADRSLPRSPRRIGDEHRRGHTLRQRVQREHLHGGIGFVTPAARSARWSPACSRAPTPARRVLFRREQARRRERCCQVDEISMSTTTRGSRRGVVPLAVEIEWR